MELMGISSSPSWMKSGKIKLEGEICVSRIISRSTCDLRFLRGREGRVCVYSMLSCKFLCKRPAFISLPTPSPFRRKRYTTTLTPGGTLVEDSAAVAGAAAGIRPGPRESADA